MKEAHVEKGERVCPFCRVWRCYPYDGEYDCPECSMSWTEDMERRAGGIKEFGHKVRDMQSIMYKSFLGFGGVTKIEALFKVGGVSEMEKLLCRSHEWMDGVGMIEGTWPKDTSCYNDVLAFLDALECEEDMT